MSGKYARPKSHRPFLPVVAGLGILMLGVLIVGTASAEPVEVGPVAGESECAEASVTVTWDGATVTKVVVGFEDSGDPEDPATRNHAEVTVFADDTSVFWQDVTTFESTGLVTPDKDGNRVQVAFGEGQAVCAILVEAPGTKPEPEPTPEPSPSVTRVDTAPEEPPGGFREEG